MNTRLTVVIKQLLHNQSAFALLFAAAPPPTESHHSQLMELTSSSFFSQLQTAAQEFITVSNEQFLLLHVTTRSDAVCIDVVRLTCDYQCGGSGSLPNILKRSAA